jgi:murein DD-endopeptidase MepM/ murein hydrolase activator NlpD
MTRLILCWLLYAALVACDRAPASARVPSLADLVEADSLAPLDRLFRQSGALSVDGFDFPVGKPDARGYYNAQPFGRNTHLGDDWNAVTGGNSDLGDPVYAVANGCVTEATDHGGGWGAVIRVVHGPQAGPYRFVESLYAHCDTMLVKPGDWVRRGQKIGTIGTAHGRYWAHLHLELRWKLGLPLGGGYSSDTTGFLEPTAFIRKY